LKEQEFNKVISDLVLALEKAGAYTPELKSTIDNLFYLKDLVIMRDTMSSSQGTCFRCSHYDNGFCTLLSATLEDGVQLELPPAKKDSIHLKVPMIFRCNFYKA
jgi:hypothetical protein